MDRPRPRNKRIFAAAIAVALAVAGTLAVTEGATRVLLANGRVSGTARLKVFGTGFFEMRYDPVLGWVNPSNLDLDIRHPEFSGRITTNAMGLRDREYPVEKPRGATRILVLGDSVSWGWGVSQEKSYPEVLERMLADKRPGAAPVEVINASVTGYGTDQEYLLLDRLAPILKPDIVLLFYYGNDCPNNVDSLQYRSPKPLFLDVDGKLTLANVPVPRRVMTEGNLYLLHSCAFLHHASALYRVLLTRGQTSLAAARWLDRLGLADLRYVSSIRNPESCHLITRRLLGAIKTKCEETGARLLVVNCPATGTLDASFEGRRPDSINDALPALTEDGFDFVDLPAAFWKRGLSKDEFTLPEDDHFNPFGHEVVAGILFDRLTTGDYLPDR